MDDKKEMVEVDAKSIEALADNIANLTKAANKMMDSGLTEETIVLLLHDHSRVGKRAIKDVLRSLTGLGYYLKN